MPFLTYDQLIAVIDKQRCLYCDNEATNFPKDKEVAYCDEHFHRHEFRLDIIRAQKLIEDAEINISRYKMDIGYNSEL